MKTRDGWRRLGRPLVSAAVGGLVAWFAFVADRPVPVLDWFDLGVHEAGHLLAAWLPRLAMFLAGSVVQVAFPLFIAGYFWARARDAAASGFCLAWAGASAWDVSVYAGDAVSQSLPLVGGGEHDWAYILGPHGFDALHLTGSVAGFIEFSGAVMAVLGIGIALKSAAAGISRAPSTISRVPPPARTSLAVTPHDGDPWLAAAALPFRHAAD
ncbi:MAG: hypothetical protein WEE36_10715 [Acidimicrobiia bacterium]